MGPHPRRLTRWQVAGASLAAALLAGAGPFEGCGAPAGPMAVPLPRASEPACVRDEECATSSCEVRACVEGACRVTAPFIDVDLDGVAPPPCGNDCDDTLASTAPDAPESCDAVDQDCDGRIDEGASMAALSFPLSTTDPTFAAAAWGDEFLISDAGFSSRGVRSRRVARNGAVGVPGPLLDTPLRARFVRAAATDDGAVFALALEDPSGDPVAAPPSLTLVRLRRAADGAVEPASEPTRLETIGVTALALVVVQGEPVLAWTDIEGTRQLWSPGWSDRVTLSPADALETFGLASDGTHAVFAVDGETLAFVGIGGLEEGRQTTTSPLSSGQVLASGDGFVWAVVRDAFDFSVERVSLTEVGRPAILPSGDTERLRLSEVDEGLLLVREGRSGLLGWLLDPASPESALTTFGADQLGLPPPSQPASVTLLRAAAGAAILSNYGDSGAVLTVLACGQGA